MASSPASIWQAGNGVIPIINAAGQIQEQWFIATAAQTVFTLTLFQYTPATRSIFVYVNGVVQQRSVDFIETSNTLFTFTTGLNVGDKVCAIGYAILGVLTS